MRSKMEGFMILDSENAEAAKDKLTVVKTTKVCPGNVVRRKLADISNVPTNPMPSFQVEKLNSISGTTKEYIDHLQKEHMAVVKMLAQRNKIIEQSGIELERLGVNLLKMQEQNQQLALSNSQMLTELNSGKDRLKALQHELGCKNGLLKAIKLQLEEKAISSPCQNLDVEVKLVKHEEPEEPSKEYNAVEKPCNAKRRLPSHGPGSTEQVQSQNKVKKKRVSVRRQSARFKVEEKEPAEDSFEIPYDKFPTHPLPDDSFENSGSISASASVKNEINECISALRYEPQEFGRSSLARPSRHAVIKVQSYKEIPLNVKMRRS